MRILCGAWRGVHAPCSRGPRHSELTRSSGVPGGSGGPRRDDAGPAPDTSVERRNQLSDLPRDAHRHAPPQARVNYILTAPHSIHLRNVQADRKYHEEKASVTVGSRYRKALGKCLDDLDRNFTPGQTDILKVASCCRSAFRISHRGLYKKEVLCYLFFPMKWSN